MIRFQTPDCLAAISGISCSLFSCKRQEKVRGVAPSTKVTGICSAYLSKQSESISKSLFWWSKRTGETWLAKCRELQTGGALDTELPLQRSSSRWKPRKEAFATLLEYGTVILGGADGRTHTHTHTHTHAHTIITDLDYTLMFLLCCYIQKSFPDVGVHQICFSDLFFQMSSRHPQTCTCLCLSCSLTHLAAVQLPSNARQSLALSLTYTHTHTL